MTELMLLPFNPASPWPAERPSAVETGTAGAADFAALLALENSTDAFGERNQEDGEAPESAARFVALPEPQNIEQTASLSLDVMAVPSTDPNTDSSTDFIWRQQPAGSLPDAEPHFPAALRSFNDRTSEFTENRFEKLFQTEGLGLQPLPPADGTPKLSTLPDTFDKTMDDTSEKRPHGNLERFSSESTANAFVVPPSGGVGIMQTPPEGGTTNARSELLPCTQLQTELDQVSITRTKEFLANLAEPWRVMRETQPEVQTTPAKMHVKTAALFASPRTELKTDLSEQLEPAPTHALSEPPVANSSATPAGLTARAEEFCSAAVTEFDSDVTAAPIAELPTPPGLPVRAPSGIHDKLATQQPFLAQTVDPNPCGAAGLDTADERREDAQLISPRSVPSKSPAPGEPRDLLHEEPKPLDVETEQTTDDHLHLRAHLTIEPAQTERILSGEITQPRATAERAERPLGKLETNPSPDIRRKPSEDPEPRNAPQLDRPLAALEVVFTAPAALPIEDAVEEPINKIDAGAKTVAAILTPPDITAFSAAAPAPALPTPFAAKTQTGEDDGANTQLRLRKPLPEVKPSAVIRQSEAALPQLEPPAKEWFTAAPNSLADFAAPDSSLTSHLSPVEDGLSPSAPPAPVFTQRLGAPLPLSENIPAGEFPEEAQPVPGSRFPTFAEDQNNQPFTGQSEIRDQSLGVRPAVAEFSNKIEDARAPIVQGQPASPHDPGAESSDELGRLREMPEPSAENRQPTSPLTNVRLVASLSLAPDIIVAEKTGGLLGDTAEEAAPVQTDASLATNIGSVTSASAQPSGKSVNPPAALPDPNFTDAEAFTTKVEGSHNYNRPTLTGVAWRLEAVDPAFQPTAVAAAEPTAIEPAAIEPAASWPSPNGKRAEEIPPPLAQRVEPEVVELDSSPSRVLTERPRQTFAPSPRPERNPAPAWDVKAAPEEVVAATEPRLPEAAPAIPAGIRETLRAAQMTPPLEAPLPAARMKQPLSAAFFRALLTEPAQLEREVIERGSNGEATADRALRPWPTPVADEVSAAPEVITKPAGGQTVVGRTASPLIATTEQFAQGELRGLQFDSPPPAPQPVEVRVRTNAEVPGASLPTPEAQAWQPDGERNRLNTAARAMRLNSEVEQVEAEPLPAELQPVDITVREQFNATPKIEGAPKPEAQDKPNSSPENIRLPNLGATRFSLEQDIVESGVNEAFARDAKTQTERPGQITARPVDAVPAELATNQASRDLSGDLSGRAESAPPPTSVGLLTLGASGDARDEALPSEVLSVRENLSARLAAITSQAAGLDVTQAPRPSGQRWPAASSRRLPAIQAEFPAVVMNRPATPPAVRSNSTTPFTNESPPAQSGEFDLQLVSASADKGAFARVAATLYSTSDQPLQRGELPAPAAQSAPEDSSATGEPPERVAPRVTSPGVSAGDSKGNPERTAAVTDKLTTQLERPPTALEGVNDKPMARRTISEARVKPDPNELTNATAAGADWPVPVGRGTPVAQATGTGVASGQNVAEQLAGPLIEASEQLMPGEPRILRLKLRPRELGQVEIEIRRDVAGRLSAHLTVEHEQANRVLRDEMGQLREALERAGLQVGRLDVSTGQGSGWHAGGQSNQSYQAETQPAGSAPDQEYPALDPFNGGAQAAQDRLLNLHA